MASTSIVQYCSSSSDLKKTYDVFVSFRGDTRNSFTNHLFDALRRNCIHFFSDADDRKLKKGKLILTELLQAIEGSQILIVVFSKAYASSKWCLRELEKIANPNGKHVVPIFYDVSPSEVRKQEGDYKKAFDEYEEKFEKDKEKMMEVRRWREALSRVGNLSGWDIGAKPQAEEIKKIVQSIQDLLHQNIVNSPNDGLVGVQSRIAELKRLLFLDSVDVVMTLGIYGLAGIGKTALVAALCKTISRDFDFCHCIEDVKNRFLDSNKLGFANQSFRQAPAEYHLDINNFFRRTNLLGRRLIVLDNVDNIEQLERLALNHTCLGAGSRIIIITTDRRILEDYGVNHIYHVQPLNDDNAIQLFHKYAFKGNCVMSEYEELKYDVMSYLDGHPLLIKVVGRHLANQDVMQWRNALVKLRANPKKDIMNKLRICVDDLERNEKEIFLDIACFYAWYSDYDAIEVLQFRGFDPDSGLKILLEKSLISYCSGGSIDMPTMLIDLGKYIVKEKFPEKPRKRSRLWDYHDFLKVMSHSKAAKNLEVIVVDGYDLLGSTIKVNAISKMSQLKILQLKGMEFSGSLNDLSNELGYLTWLDYPFKCLPPAFQPANLVSLVMRCSSIERLWKTRKPLPALKYLDLSDSKNLVQCPNFGEASNLQRLCLDGCIQLRKIHSSICVLRKLTYLNLKNCKCLVKIPDFGEASNLEYIRLEGCIRLKELHESIGFQRSLTYLNLKHCKSLVSLPNSLLGLSSLEYLNLSGCSDLYNTRFSVRKRFAQLFKMPWFIREAPINSQSISSTQIQSFMPSFQSLRELDLSFCNLHQVPDAIGDLCILQWLNLRGNKFEKIPSLKKLSKLLYINLEHCKQLKSSFELPSQTKVNLPADFIRWGQFTTRMRGLNIFSCPKLVGREEWTWKSILWMIQIVKAFYPDFTNCDFTEFVIPGDDIPKWFNKEHEGMGNSISVNAPPFKQDDNNWIGIAFCVVFCASRRRKNSLPNMSFRNSLPNISFRHYISVLLDVDVVTDMSDHVYLLYLPRELLVIKCRFGLLDSDRIGVKFITFNRRWDFEVKKYGYRWIYEQDLQLSNMASEHFENSSNRKLKLMEIKEKQ